MAGLPLGVFTASDSLGWVYQFWQAKKKEAVNASEVKIGARELPAVTQLFTEPYMVSFLLDNSLGAWWAARQLTEADLQNASSEEELRRKAAIPGVPLDYLRFVQQENGSWTPAAGTFNGWPEQLADLKTLDPCCGSGHFLVAAFLMLVPMRMERDGFSARDAVNAVLRENIHGLELDQRCVELAAFALALTAWKYPSAGGYRVLPELNVACSGLSISAKKEDWLALSGENTTLRQALGELYKHFSDAPVLGSLINPESSLRKNDLFELQREDIQPLLARALEGEPGDERTEMGIVAQGLAKAADLLSDTYHWVVTNVPYLARGKQDEILRSFCEQHYPEARNDLATVFLDRCLDFCSDNGTTSIVLPQNWLFLTSYKKFREKLLKNDTWHLIARLGPQAFQTPMWDFNVQLITLGRGNATKESGGLFGDVTDGNLIRGVDVSEPRTASEKAAQLLTGEIKSVEQAKQLGNPDARVLLDQTEASTLLGEHVEVPQGIKTGDDNRFRFNFWEMQTKQFWRFYQSTPDNIEGKSFSGLSNILRWENEGSELARKQGEFAWGKSGIAISQMASMPWSFFTGEIQDSNINVVVPIDNDYLESIVAYGISQEFKEAVRQLDQKLSVTNATLKKVPFDLEHWTTVAEEEYPNGLPKPYTDDPTQWIFHGHPCGSVVWDEKQKWTAHGPLRTDDSVLHVATARLLGYRWPAELDASMELADEQREWVKCCEALAGYADDDGIVCIPPVRGEASASDRLLNLLAAAYGDAWSNDTLAALLKSADHAGKTLETWLREKFFTQHCKLFQHRPFICTSGMACRAALPPWSTTTSSTPSGWRP